jgi:ATP-dependent metalloprotease
MSLLNQNATPLYKVTVLPKSGSLGHTAFIPENDELSHTKKKLVATIEVALGGRAAEEVFLGPASITSGCSSDLQKATQIAYAYVRSMGMSEKVSILAGDKKAFSDEQNFVLDSEANRLVQEAYSRVKLAMRANSDAIERLVDQLVKRETLSAEEFRAVFEGREAQQRPGPQA